MKSLPFICNQDITGPCWGPSKHSGLWINTDLSQSPENLFFFLKSLEQANIGGEERVGGGEPCAKPNAAHCKLLTESLCLSLSPKPMPQGRGPPGPVTLKLSALLASCLTPPSPSSHSYKPSSRAFPSESSSRGFFFLKNRGNLLPQLAQRRAGLGSGCRALQRPRERGSVCESPFFYQVWWKRCSVAAKGTWT